MPENEQIKDLIKKAVEAQKNAYCPYSDYSVGAAVLSEGGHIYVGWNVEAVTFSQSTHAEQNAVCRMPESDRKIKMIAFASRNGGAPCGHCRQIISEFAGPETKIIGYASDNSAITIKTLAELLPLPMKTGKDALTK